MESDILILLEDLKLSSPRVTLPFLYLTNGKILQEIHTVHKILIVQFTDERNLPI